MNKEIINSFELLKKIYFENAYSSIELNKLLNKNKDELNTNLITKIVYGVMEKDIYLSYVVDQFVKVKPNQNVYLILKIGTYIGKFLNSIPSFALVNELVEITKKESISSSGFVNATLKNIINSDVKLPDESKDKVYYLSVKYNYPQWVIRELISQHNVDFAEKLIAYEPTTLTHIRLFEKIISPKEFISVLEKNNIEYEKSYFDFTLYVDYGKVLNCTELDGKYVVQGLPSIITCEILNANFGYCLDVCSAPGGKSCYIAQKNDDVVVTACDLYAHRTLLISGYAKKLGLTNVKVVKNDATIMQDIWKEKFDFVLCDVPCSNLGVSRKKPDILLNKTLNDVSTLSGIQLKILQTASNYLKKGGIIVYSTCSILKQENEDVINKFLLNNKNFELVKADCDFNMNIQSNKDGIYAFYPHLCNCEGFFIGRLKKL